MLLLAIILVTISALAHSSWNLICKAKAPSSAFFFLLTVVSVLLTGIPLLIFYPDTLKHISPVLWGIFVLTGFLQAGYYIFLAKAYSISEISVTYPLTRSIPVLLTPLITFLFAFGKTPHPLAIFGMVLMFFGCMILPQQKFSEIFCLKNYKNKGFIIVLITAFFITTYGITDKEGLRLIESEGAIQGNFKTSLFFITLENSMIALWLIPRILFSKNERGNILSTIRGYGVHYPIIASVLCTGAYMLVLSAMQLTDNVSYVVAFRQLGIPIGATLGIMILKEQKTLPKFVGIALIFTGLVFVAIF